MIKEILDKYDKIYPIRLDIPGAGFGAVILTTMNLVRYCERNNFYPVVSYDAKCKTAFFDADHGNELWGQYFEPVMPISYEAFQNLIKESPVPQNRILQPTTEEAVKISEEHPDSVCTFTFGKWRYEALENLDIWYNNQREKGRETISKYVRPKRHILEKVDAFYHKHLSNKFVLGLHIRGTDMNYAPIVSPAEYFPHIDEQIRQEPDLKIFLATDQKQYIEVLTFRYGDRLVYADCFRSDNEIAPFERTGSSPYKKGEDVLLDILLLSRANFLIKGGSNVGEMALYFNEELECLDLSYKKTKAYGEDYKNGWEPMSNRTAWDVFSKRGMTTIAKDADTQSNIQAIGFKLRKAAKYTRVYLGALKRKILS